MEGVKKTKRKNDSVPVSFAESSILFQYMKEDLHENASRRGLGGLGFLVLLDQLQQVGKNV
jgi:hypothetical protein